jgi:triosephosphate isomerase (TIM)
MRTKIIAGNWKLYKGPREAGAYAAEVAGAVAQIGPKCEVVVGPPFTSLAAVTAALQGSPVRTAAQNVFWEDGGAFTGEVSAAMLKEIGCAYVIVGHSERRQYFGETDETVNRKLKAVLKADLIPIFCLGESLAERESERAFDVVGRQLRSGLEGIVPTDPARFVIAYEPVWAIGTGRTATPEQAQEIHAFLRSGLRDVLGEGAASGIRILYGGSIKPENTKGLMSKADIDGGLIGGASLKLADFMGIIDAAEGIH